MSKLLVRPPLKEDEWWYGYVARVLFENGYWSKHQYMLGRLQQLVRELISANAFESHHAGDDAPDGTRRIGGLTLPGWAVRGLGSATWFCPRCLERDGYLRLVWRLKTWTYCPEHHLHQIDKCIACQRKIFHWDAARKRCRCGQDLTDPGGIGSAQTHEPNSFELLIEDLRVATASALRVGREQEEIVALYVFVMHLVNRLSAVKFEGMSWRPGDVDGFIEHLSLIRLQRVEDICALWSALPAAVHLREAQALVCGLIFEERRAPTVLACLPLDAWATELANLGACPSKARRKGWIQPDEYQPRLIPQAHAAKLAGIGEMHLHHLVLDGLVKPTRTYQVGEMLKLFSMAQIDEISRFKSMGYAYGNAMRVGLPRHACKYLHRANLLSRSTDRLGRHWLAGDQLRELIQALKAVAMPGVDVSGQ